MILLKGWNYCDCTLPLFLPFDPCPSSFPSIFLTALWIPVPHFLHRLHVELDELTVAELLQRGSTIWPKRHALCFIFPQLLKQICQKQHPQHMWKIAYTPPHYHHCLTNYSSVRFTGGLKKSQVNFSKINWIATSSICAHSNVLELVFCSTGSTPDAFFKLFCTSPLTHFQSWWLNL